MTIEESFQHLRHRFHPSAATGGNLAVQVVITGEHALRDSRKLNYPRDDRVRSFERYVKRGYSAERGSERTANLAAVPVPETGV
jgi:hypothetical protein